MDSKEAKKYVSGISGSTIFTARPGGQELSDIFKRVSDHYYVHLNPKAPQNKGLDEWQKVKGESVKLLGFEQFDLFAHKIFSKKQYTISEAITGQQIGAIKEATSEQAIQAAGGILERIGVEALYNNIVKQGKTKGYLSPRYKLI